MPFFVVLFFAVFAAIVVMPIVAIVRANSFARSLREEMAGIMDRIRDLEGQLRKLAMERSAAVAAPSAQADHATSAPASATLAAPPAAKVEATEHEPAAIPDAWKAAAAAPARVPDAQ